MDDALAKVASPLAVRCVDLEHCGWGILPSVRQLEEVQRLQDRCACCGGPMQTVTSEEFHGRRPHEEIAAS